MIRESRTWKRWVRGGRRGVSGLSSHRLAFEPLEDRRLLSIRVWDGGGANAFWTTPANWAGDIAPMAGDDLVFPDAAAQKTNQNDFAANTRFNTIQFTGSGYTVTGNAIELFGGLVASNTSGTNTFSLATKLINAQSFVASNPGTTLNFTATIDTGILVGTTNFLGTSALTFDGAGTINVSGKITGQGSVSKYGSGMTVLSAANDYEGLTDVRQGVLKITHGQALGTVDTGETQIQAGAALHVEGGITVAEALAIREGGVGFGEGTDPSSLGALRGVGGVNTWTGPIDLAGGNNLIGVDAGSVLNISGVIGANVSGTNRLIKVGPGTLQLTGNQPNTFRGETRVLQGTLELGKTAGLDAIGDNLVIGDNIEGNGTETVRLLSDHQIREIDWFGMSLNTITINSTGVLDLNGHAEKIGNLTMYTGVTQSSHVLLGSGTLILGGSTITLSTFQGSSGLSPAATIEGGTLDIGTFFSGSGGGTNKVISVSDTQLNHIATDLIISANIVGSADVSLRKDGGGSLRLAGDNSGLAGPFIVYGGIIEIASDTAFGTGLLSLQADGNTLMAYGGNRTVTNPVSLDSRVHFIGDNNITFTGPATLTGNRDIRVMDPDQTVEFAGGIGEGIFGSLGITKRGLGTLLLTGTNTFSGALTISNEDSGPLRLAGNGTVLNANSLTVGLGGHLIIDNSTTNLPDRINDATYVALGGKITLLGKPGQAVSETLGVVNVDGDRNGTLESVYTGSGSTQLILRRIQASATGSTATFIGTGAPLTLGGPNRISLIEPLGTNMTLVGGIIPSAVVLGPGGTVDFATVASSPTGFDIIAPPASFYVTSLAAAGPTSTVRLSASEVVPIGKTINAILLEPGVSLTGAEATLTLTSGGIVFAGPGTSDISVGVLGASTTYRIHTQQGVTATINSRITGGALAKYGFGKLILTGDNTYTSTTVISEGILNIQRSTALGSPGGSTALRERAVLELEETTFGPINVGLEYLDWRGTGPDFQASLRNVAGNNSWAGNISTGGSVLDFSGLFDGFPVLSNQAVIIDVAAGSLNLSGAISGTEIIKRGPGTLEYSGTLANTYDAATRILEGKLRLNKAPGVNALINHVYIGVDAPGAPAAELELGSSEQIRDDRVVYVHGPGLFDLNGQTESLQYLYIVAGEGGTGDATLGSGTLTFNYQATDNLTVIALFTEGFNRPEGATITGGTIALNGPGMPYISAARATRYFQVNDGAMGDDLTITSAIVDGSGLVRMILNKNGFGTLVFGGSTPNTYTGYTQVLEGTLVLDKGTGSGGISAMACPLYVGSGDPYSGYAGSDVVRWRQDEQLPDWGAAVYVRSPGLMDLDGHNETIGTSDAQNALLMYAASQVATGTGTLTVNGNIYFEAATGVAIWTPVAPPVITGRLRLNDISRSLNIGDRTELPFDAIIAADISGTGGLLKTGSGMLLLSGNNTYSGDTFINGGLWAIGSDSAFGTGRVRIYNDRGILAAYGPRIVPNETYLPNAGQHYGYWNDLTFTGPVNGTGGTITARIVNAVSVEFAGGLGETNAAATALTKEQFGKLIISGKSTYSGTTTVAINGGTLVFRGEGTAINSPITVNVNGVVEIDNATGTNLSNRIGELATVTLAGGTLAFTGKPGELSYEAFGQLTLNDNTASTIQILTSPTPGSSSQLRIANVYRSANVAAMVNFVGRGADIGATTASKIFFTTAPTLTDGILPYAVITNSTGLEFATWTNPSPGTTPYDNALTPLTTYATSFAGATATTNVKLSTSQTLSGNVTVNAVLMAGGSIEISESAASNLTIDTGLLAAAGAGDKVTTTTLTLGGTEGFVYTAPGADLEVSSVLAGATSSLGKAGLGTLVLSGTGANTFTGATRVEQGIYRAQKNTAFGTTAGNVVVQYGATVELAGGVTIPAEQIDLYGNGEGLMGMIPLRNVSGPNTWQGNVRLLTNRTGIHVEDGSELILNGVVSKQGLNKFGKGILELGGTASNTFVQTSIIWDGTLELNKSAGTNAIPTLNDNAVFYIGDFRGRDNTVLLKSLANDQIADGNFRVEILGTGLWDVNGKTETLTGRTGGTEGALRMWVQPLCSADIDLNGGTIRLGNTTAARGDFYLVINRGGAPVPATIADGTLELVQTAGQTRTFSVDDSAAMEDLIITATIADGGGQGLLAKTGSGALVLDPTTTNTYTGTTTVGGGELIVRKAGALGASSAGTTVSSGYTLILDGPITDAEPLTLNGTGFGGRGAVYSRTGNNTLSGAISLAADSRVCVAAGTELNLSGAISGSGGLTKYHPGTLRYSGTSANTYTGITYVNEGALLLDKGSGSGGVNAIAGTLIVGDHNGGQDADVVRLLQPNQIADTTSYYVSVYASGLLDLNGKDETIVGPTSGGLGLVAGPTFSGRVDTQGAAPTAGTLTLGNTTSGTGRTNLSSTGTATTQSPGARISGKINLGSLQRQFDVVDAGMNIRELVIDASITGTAGLTRSNTGLMVVNSNNSATLSGTITLQSGGGLVVGHNGALGSGTIDVSADTSLFTANYDGTPSPITLPNAITLNANLTVRGDENWTFNGAVTNSGGNRTLTLNVNPATAVNLNGFVNLSESSTARTLTINDNTFMHMTYVNGVVRDDPSSASTSALTKGGTGVLVLTGNNTFKGAATVSAGALAVAHPNALGTVAGGTTVSSNAALILVGNPTMPLTWTEPLTLSSIGYNGLATGGLRLFNYNTGAETVYWNGNITLSGTSAIGVDAGGASGDRLILGGTGVLSGAALVQKVGAGTLELAGTASNIHTGGTQVCEGILLLNKSGPALATGYGLVTVGDHGGGASADVIRYAATAGDDQIASAVTVNSSGLLDFATNNKTDTIAELTLITGPTSSAHVAIGSVPLMLGGDIWVDTFGPTDGSSPPATITGDLNGVVGFVINDTTVPSPSEDLVIDGTVNGAVVSGGYAAGLAEGRIGANFDNTTPNPKTAVRLLPRAGETNLKTPVGMWGDNETWVYTGQIYDADGYFSLAENIDDNVVIWIDGLERLRNQSYNIPTTTGSTTNNSAPSGNVTTNFGMGPNNDGWHDIEIRVSQGTGGAGAVAGTGWSAFFGLGLNTAGSTLPNGFVDGYILPADNGTQNLFRTAWTNAQSNLTKSGTGTLALTGAATHGGTVTINAGQITLRGAGSLASVAGVTINTGATLVLEDSAAALADRLADIAPITLNGGTLSYVGNASGSTETIGTITLGSGTGAVSTIRSATTGAGTVQITSAGLTRADNSGATVNFVGVNDDLGSADNKIIFSAAPDGQIGGILPYATLTGSTGIEFVEHDGTNGINPSPFVTSLAAAGPTDNVKLSASESISGDKTINALMLAGNAITVSGSYSLSVSGGQVIGAGGANTIATSTLAFGAEEPILTVGTGATLAVSSAITGSAPLRKEGLGKLVFSGNNATFSGAMTVNQGILNIQHASALGTTAGPTTVNPGAALELGHATGLALGAEPVTLRGVGVDANNPATLRSIQGDNSLSGPITLDVLGGAVVYVSVDAGKLTLTGAIGQSGTVGLTKLGFGTLEFGGSGDNGYTGTTTVAQGTVILNKTANNSFSGSLVVGDLIGTDQVIYGTAAGGDQVENGRSVTVNAGALLDMATNAKSDYITNLTMTGGEVRTGTATLTMAGTLTYNSGEPALITGKLDLAYGTRTFTINDGYALHDLTIDAQIVNGRISKGGGGIVLLTHPGNQFFAGVDEVQRITFSADTDSTTQFTVTFNTLTTGTITGGSTPAQTAANIQSAMEALTNIGSGNVSVTALDARNFNVTFLGPLGSANLPDQISATKIGGAGGTVSTSTIINGVGNEVQNIAFSAATNNTTQFTLTFCGRTTSTINGGATAAETAANIQAALAALPNIGTGNVRVLANNTQNFRVLFIGGLGLTDIQDVFTGTVTSGPGGTITGSQVTAGAGNEVQNITFSAATDSSTRFTLTYNGMTTGTIAGGATAADTAANMQAALEAMANIGLGNVAVLANSTTTFRVIFRNAFGLADLPNTFTGTVTAGPGGTISSAQVIAGVSPVVLSAGGIAFTTNSALGSNRIHISGSSQLLPEGGDRTLTNPITISPNITVTLGGRRDFGGTDDLVLAGDVTLIGPTSAQVIAFNVQDPEITATMGGVVRGGGDLLVFNKTGLGTLVLSGNNTFEVRDTVLVGGDPTLLGQTDGVRVDYGILRLAHSNAMGVGNYANVHVRGDLQAALEIDGSAGPVNIANRHIVLFHFDNGWGLGALYAPTGVLRSLAGNNSITGQLDLRNIADNGNNGYLLVGVDAGSLDVVGQIVGTRNNSSTTATQNRYLTKVGAGTLRTSGTTNNLITGTIAVAEGTLELNKSGAAKAVLAPLFIGQNAGGDNAGRVVYANTTATDQIDNAVNVTINPTGLLDLNGASDQINALTQFVGATVSGDVATGTGTLTTGGYTVNILPGILTGVACQISGKVNLLDTAAAKTFTVNDGPGEIELEVTAQVVEAAATQGITKAGAGRMVLNPSTANTFASNLTITGGVLRIKGDTPLGTTAGTTTVNGGTALELDNVTAGTAESVFIRDYGIVNGPITAWRCVFGMGTGALRNVAGNNTWSGTITLNGNDSLIEVVAGTKLTLSGVIAQSGTRSLHKSGEGTLEFAGSSDNTYTGDTLVTQGTLVLNKTGTAKAIEAGTLIIGDNIGGDNADQVVFGNASGFSANQLDDVAIAINSTGRLDLAGKTETNNANVTLGVGPTSSGDLVTGTGSYVMNGGTVYAISMLGTTATTPAATIQGTFDLSNGGRNFDVRKSIAAPVELDVQAVLTSPTPSSGGINKYGRGTMILSGANGYTGGTTVREDSGILLVNTPDTVAASAYTVYPGAILGGWGRINGTLSVSAPGNNLPVGGTLSPGGVVPGNTTGVLTVNNNVTFSERSTFTVEINGSTAGTDYDQLRVTGTGSVTITTTGAGVTLAGSTGYQPVNGTTYTLIDKQSSGAISGNFVNAVPPSPPAVVVFTGKTYQFGYALGDGNDFVLTAVKATRVWDGGGADNNWTTAANWTGDVTPYLGDDLVFDDTGVGVRPNPNNDFAAGTFDIITLNTSAGSYTLGGNAVTLTGRLVGQAGTHTVNQTITGGGGLTVSGGTVTLFAANAYTGATLVSGGTLRLGADDVIPDGSGSGDVTINVGGTLDLAGHNETVNGLAGNGIVDNTAGTGTYTLAVGAGDASSTFSGVVQNTNGTVALTKIGTGTLTLAGASTYGGLTTIAAGAIRLGADDVLPDGAAAGNVSIAAGATLDLAGRSDAINGLVGTGFVDNTTSGAGTLRVGAADTSSTFDGVLQNTSGTLALVKIGAGTFILTSANTYDGSTSVSAGLLEVRHGSALGSTAAGTTVAGGATLALSGGITLVEPLTLNGSGVGGLGALRNLSQDNATSGTIQLASSSAIGVDTLGDELSINAAITGAAGSDLSKVGDGTLILAAANTYAGGTVVTDGVLLVNGSTAGGTVTVTGGTLGGTGTIGGPIVATGGTVSPGTSPGILTGSAAVTFGAASTFRVELDGAAPGSGYDRLVAGGMVDLGGSTLDLSRTFNPPASTTFTILENVSAASTVGQFAGLPEGSTINLGGIAFRITYQGGDGNDVVLTRLAFGIGTLVVDAGLDNPITPLNPSDPGWHPYDDVLRAQGTSPATQAKLQHSMVTRIVVTLDGVMTSYTPDAFRLQLLGPGGGDVNLRIQDQVVGGSTVFTITFGAGPGVYPLANPTDFALIDGDFRLTIDASKIHDAEGDLAAGRVDQFFRFFGDSDGDRDVDGTDLNRVRRVIAGDPNFAHYRWAFDYDGNGAADNFDYTRFRAHYGKKLRPVAGALQQGLIAQLRTLLRR